MFICGNYCVLPGKMDSLSWEDREWHKRFHTDRECPVTWPHVSPGLRSASLAAIHSPLWNLHPPPTTCVTTLSAPCHGQSYALPLALSHCCTILSGYLVLLYPCFFLLPVFLLGFPASWPCLHDSATTFPGPPDSIPLSKLQTFPITPTEAVTRAAHISKMVASFPTSSPLTFLYKIWHKLRFFCN